MIKKLLIIGLLTGVGHLVTLLSLKFISKNVGNEVIASIGEFDSLSLLVISIISFGLQLSATRELALLKDWKTEYYTTQSARLTLSLGLIFIGFTGFFFTKNYLFFMAPIIALNGDYALYGRGKPIMGAIIALIRILIPSLTLVVSSIFFQDRIVLLFCLSLVLAYILAGVSVSKALNVNYFVKPKINHLSKYIKNLNIGIASFSLFFVGIGIINVMSYFYNNDTIAVVYIALKLYMIFKGVRRIIVQSFFKDLQDSLVAIKVDYFAIIVGIVFLSTIIFFPKVLINLLFDEKFNSYVTTFIILGIAGFISSFTTSSGTRLLLKKRDKSYSINLIIAAIVSIVSGVLFWILIGDYPFLIAISVLLGEITISILNVISLKETNFLEERLKIIYPLVFLSIIFFISENYFSQSLYAMIGCLIVYGLISLVYTKKAINF